MALATGILVGSSLLNQELLDQQRADNVNLGAQREALRRELDATAGELAYRDNYLDELRETLLPDRLVGHRVSLVAMPGASGKDVDALARTLVDSGAQLAGRIVLSDDLFADAEIAELAGKAKLRDDTFRKHALSNVKNKAPAAQLAAALLTKESGRALEPAAEGLLTELDRAGMISRVAIAAPGDLAVLVTGPTPTKGTPTTDRRRSGSVALAAAMDSASKGTVVVGPAQDSSGAVQAVRKEAAVAEVVSTVDSVETPFGQVATVYALVEQIAGGAGQYGSANAGDAPLPRLRASTAKR